MEPLNLGVTPAAGMTLSRLPIVFLVLSFCLSSCVSAPPPRQADSVTRTDFVAASYRLGVGDRVRVDVFREADLSGEVSIESTGYINYPLIGTITAVGLTAQQLERELIARFRAGYLRNPDVRVAVVRYRPIFISGAVRNTGAFPFSEGLTVERALTLASGMTPLGSPRRIFALREGAPASAREKVGLDAPLYPGDTLFVEEGVF